MPAGPGGVEDQVHKGIVDGAVAGQAQHGTAVGPALQSQISKAASATNQGETMGAVAALNSLMAVIAPPLGLGLMYLVADLPRTDARIGAPFFFIAVLQALSLFFALRYFATQPPQAEPAAASSTL